MPVKPLLQFKSVSKRWLSLVSYPNFCFLHTQYQHQRQGVNGSGPTLLLLSHGCSPSPQFQLVPLQDASTKTVLPFLDYLNVPRVKILQSFNGLLLCRTSFLVNPDDPVVVQQSLFDAAKEKRDACIRVVKTWDEFEEALNERKMLLAPWCDQQEVEDDVKERTKDKVGLLGQELLGFWIGPVK